MVVGLWVGEGERHSKIKDTLACVFSSLSSSPSLPSQTNMKSTSAAGAGAVIRRPGAGAVVSKGVGGEERERQPTEKNARWRASRRGDRALPATLSTWPARPSWLAVGSRVIAGSRDLGRLRQGRGEARPGARASPIARPKKARACWGARTPPSPPPFLPVCAAAAPVLGRGCGRLGVPSDTCV